MLKMLPSQTSKSGSFLGREFRGLSNFQVPKSSYHVPLDDFQSHVKLKNSFNPKTESFSELNSFFQPKKQASFYPVSRSHWMIDGNDALLHDQNLKKEITYEETPFYQWLKEDNMTTLFQSIVNECSKTSLNKDQDLSDQIEEVKVKTLEKVTQFLGPQSGFKDQNDIKSFLKIDVVKKVTSYMNEKVQKAFSIMEPEGLEKMIDAAFAKTDSAMGQYLVFDNFFMLVGPSGINSWPFLPIGLSHAFSQALCEKMAGRQLTQKEFIQEREKYRQWLPYVEKAIMLALWTFTFWLNAEVTYLFLTPMYKEMKKQWLDYVKKNGIPDLSEQNIDSIVN